LAKALPTGFRLTAFLVRAFFFEIILVADLVAGGCFSEPELEVLPSRARLMAELLFKTASRLPDLAAGAFVDERAENPTGGESGTVPRTDPRTLGFLQGESRASP
jgi:hypothetical protein